MDADLDSRAPYGARGLKLYVEEDEDFPQKSRPVWGAWIEIIMGMKGEKTMKVAPRMGRVD